MIVWVLKRKLLYPQLIRALKQWLFVLAFQLLCFQQFFVVALEAGKENRRLFSVSCRFCPYQCVSLVEVRGQLPHVSLHVSLFRRDVLLLPSIMTRYCRFGRLSVTVPVFSQWSGWEPCWFWTATESPTLSCFKSLGGVVLLFVAQRCDIAFSLMSASSIPSRRKRRGCGKWSRMGFPNSSSAGDAPMSGEGVLRCSNNAFTTESTTRVPSAPMLVIRIRFMCFTAASALPLLWA